MEVKVQCVRLEKQKGLWYVGFANTTGVTDGPTMSVNGATFIFGKEPGYVPGRHYVLKLEEVK